MNVNLGFSRLEIYVAEGLQAVYLKFREPDEHAAVSAESFEVVEALPVQRRRQTLNLEIGHIADVFAQCAFVRAGAVELETLNQASFGKHLGRCADDFSQTYVARECTYDVSAAGNPY